jgi:hypothetical protein
LHLLINIPTPWHRIGPIVTTGGYDWLQIGWDDIWDLKDALAQHSQGVYIVEQVISPVWANGTMINHPPVHIHHMHVGPAPYVRQRFDQLGCATKGRGCFNPARTLENHGDYNCVDADGGLNCRMESFPEGYELSLVLYALCVMCQPEGTINSTLCSKRICYQCSKYTDNY